MAIVPSKNAIGNGKAIITITGLAAVGTSTTGTAEEIPLSDIGIVGGTVRGFEIGCASGDFDVVIGRDNLVDFGGTPGHASALLHEDTINGGNGIRSECEGLYFGANLWFRLKNDDGVNATGAITARLLLDY